MGGVLHERDRQLGGICFARCERRKQMASVARRRSGTALESRRQRAFLHFLGQENDVCGSKSRERLRSRSTGGAVSDALAKAGVRVGGRFLCCNRRRSAISC